MFGQPALAFEAHLLSFVAEFSLLSLIHRLFSIEFNMYKNIILFASGGWGGGGGGGGTPRKVRWGVQTAFQNPYPIYDQKSAIFPTLFMT